MKLVDLSHPISARTPVYPGDPKVELEPTATLKSDGYNDHKLTMGTHLGTHIDAPFHMIKGGQILKNYPLERFLLSAICVDASNGFQADDIAEVTPAMGVLFYSGASDRFLEESYWHDYAVMPDDIVQKLIELKVGLVGVDTGSVDNQEEFPVHKALLGADILIVENLTNLKAVVGQTFELIVAPLKLEFDGAPARVIAKL